MLLVYAIIIIAFEAITEGLLKRYSLAEFIFESWVQWIIALFLFGIWLIIAFNFNGYYIPLWKMIIGFVFVRFMIFDLLWNIARGVRWNYYGTTKLYDRIMTRLGGWGIFAKAVFGIIGCCFLLGWQ